MIEGNRGKTVKNYLSNRAEDWKQQKQLSRRLEATKATQLTTGSNISNTELSEIKPVF